MRAQLSAGAPRPIESLEVPAASLCARPGSPPALEGGCWGLEERRGTPRLVRQDPGKATAHRVVRRESGPPPGAHLCPLELPKGAREPWIGLGPSGPIVRPIPRLGQAQAQAQAGRSCGPPPQAPGSRVRPRRDGHTGRGQGADLGAPDRFAVLARRKVRRVPCRGVALWPGSGLRLSPELLTLLGCPGRCRAAFWTGRGRARTSAARAAGMLMPLGGSDSRWPPGDPRLTAAAAARSRVTLVPTSPRWAVCPHTKENTHIFLFQAQT
jgi:hypothetical protein